MKFIIGYSDYTRTEIVNGWTHGSLGSVSDLIEAIWQAERDGWEVSFQTSLFRRLFCMGKYKIVATKN